MGGAIAGFQWNFAKRWFLDLNYRLAFNTPMDFPRRTINVLGYRKTINSKEFGIIDNRINLGVGLRL
jgi:hypothetical protein